MLDTAFEQVKGVADRRFLLGSFLPSLIFVSLTVAVVAGQEQSASDLIKTWDAQNGDVKLIATVVLITATVFLAKFLEGHANTVLRVYEGYWSGPFCILKEPLVRRHRRRLKKLEEQLRGVGDSAAYFAISRSYPMPNKMEHVMPTLVGNILKNAELYPEARYGIDAVVIWPRIFFVLPKSFLHTFSAARASLDVMLLVSVLGIVFAIVCSAYLASVRSLGWSGRPYPPWWACVGGGLAVAWTSYHGAIEAARTYAEQIKVAFDLYRNELLKQLHIPWPTTLDEEQNTWKELCLFLYRNSPQSRERWRYDLHLSREVAPSHRVADDVADGEQDEHG